MALELSSTTIATELVRQRQTDAQEKIHEGVRVGMSRTRHSLTNVFLIKAGSENNDDGTVTAGVYEISTNRIGISLEAMKNTISTSSVSGVQQEVAKQLENTIRHEERHQDSLTNAHRKGQSGMILQYFGKAVFHDLQETMARRGTTKGQDAYDAEEARANRFANALQMSLNELIRLVHDGEEAEIVLAAFRCGYLKPIQADLN